MSIPTCRPAHFALFTDFFQFGGVEQVLLTLAKALAEQGHRTDLVVCSRAEIPMDRVSFAVNVVELKSLSRWRGRISPLVADPTGVVPLLRPIVLPLKPSNILAYLPDLARYLRREKPTALLAAKPYPNLTALWAKRRADVATRVIVSAHGNLSRSLQSQRRPKWRNQFISPLLQRVYPWADAIVSVSNGVTDDLVALTGVPRGRITTIYNPVVTPDLHTKTQIPLDHPWFQPDAPPVVLGIGRLHQEKDFPTLLSAFARVRAQRPVRLVILGEGKLRAELEMLARTLGIAADVVMPGFVENPYAYMARAAVFALSSAWEGLPTVLIEALACGCPVVSTDCPSGPAEILDGGRYGRLVPVGDDMALARAICATLDAPPPAERLHDRALCFSADRAVKRYCRILLGS